MLNKINLLRFLIVVLFFSSIAIATETTWRHSGFEISGYDINGSSTYNLTEIRKIEFGWNTSVPAVSETNRAVMYYDDNQKQIMQSVNGGAYQAIVTNETVRPYSYSAANATDVLPNASAPLSALNMSSAVGLARIYNSTNQLNLATGVETLINLNTASYGTECTASVCTVTENGTYHIDGVITWTATVASANYQTHVYINGASAIQARDSTSVVGELTLGIHTDYKLVAGDTISLYGRSGDGVSTTDVLGGSGFTYLDYHIVRRI